MNEELSIELCHLTVGYSKKGVQLSQLHQQSNNTQQGVHLSQVHQTITQQIPTTNQPV